MTPGVKQLAIALVKKNIRNGKVSKAERRRLKEQRKAARSQASSKPLDTTTLTGNEGDLEPIPM